jgi:hypothetical protein
VIAVTQLFALGLQWVAGRSWVPAAAGLTLAILAATPLVWASGLSRRLPLALGGVPRRAGGPVRLSRLSLLRLRPRGDGRRSRPRPAGAPYACAPSGAAPSSPPAPSCRSLFADGSSFGVRRPAMSSSGSAASCCCSSRRRPWPGAEGGPSPPWPSSATRPSLSTCCTSNFSTAACCGPRRSLRGRASSGSWGPGSC